MGPWLRGMVIFLAALSTATARAQEEQPRTRPPDQPTAQQPGKADQELLRLKRQIADLTARLEAQRAEQAAAQQRAQQQLDSLRQEQAAVAQRGRAIEANRRLRAQWWAQARAALTEADRLMNRGSFDVGGYLQDARALMARAASDAAGYGYGEEAANGSAGLGLLDTIDDRLANDDLTQARLTLNSVVIYVIQAGTLAESSAAPLYAPGP